MKTLSITLTILVALTCSVSAQKVKLTKGNFNFLKGVKEINLAYDYSDMIVGKNALPEPEYVKEKVTKYNKDEAGKGDEWKKKWLGARTDRFEPEFESLFNRGLEKYGITGSKGNGSDITLTVHTTFTEPGYNVMGVKKPASCNFEYTFTNSKGDILAKLTHSGVPGSQPMGYDFDAGTRIKESYGKGAKMLAKTMTKDLK